LETGKTFNLKAESACPSSRHEIGERSTPCSEL